MQKNIFFLSLIILGTLGLVFFAEPKITALFFRQEVQEKEEIEEIEDVEEESTPYCERLVFLSTGVVVDPRCLAQKPPYLEQDFNETIDNRRDDIVGFTDEYGIHSAEFIYAGAFPVFSGELQDFALSLDDMSGRSRDVDQSSGENVILSYAQYDVWRMMNFSYYVTRRDRLDELWPCARINYDVAMIAIAGKYLQPGEEFDVNRRLAHRIWYCGTPESLSDYVFQGGVCGASSQLFRVALLHPDLTVVERHPHLIWYERYYDETIRGDDAAIIEFRKKLRMTNTGQHPIYFRSINPSQSSSAFLVAISPYQDTRRVKIERWQDTQMQGSVSTTTYDLSGNILYQTWRTSEYVERESWAIN